MAMVTPEKSLGEVISWNTPKKFEDAMSLLGQKIHEVTRGEPIERLVAAIAGALDKSKKKLVKAPNLPDWEGKSLAGELARLSNAKVMLENDAALAALGEATWGAGRRHSISAYVTVSTGVGGARVVEGKIDANAIGFEPGHQIISVGDKVGYWEDFVSGSAMERIYGKKPWDIEDDEAWDSEARLVAIGLHNLTVIWSPEIIIIGGGLTKSLDLDRVKIYMEEMKFFPIVPEVRTAELEHKSGLYGAMALMQTPGV